MSLSLIWKMLNKFILFVFVLTSYSKMIADWQMILHAQIYVKVGSTYLKQAFTF